MSNTNDTEAQSQNCDTPTTKSSHCQFVFLSQLQKFINFASFTDGPYRSVCLFVSDIGVNKLPARKKQACFKYVKQHIRSAAREIA